MKKSKSEFDISVLVATWNHAESLRVTLESFTRLDRTGISVEFVIINNNSTDNTEQVVKSFMDRLPVCYLFEPRPGKNCALNKALREASLGRLLVFTDDDVVVQEDWLKAITSVSERWPDYSVFGGKSYPVWPGENIPGWARDEGIQRSCFGLHQKSESDSAYDSNEHPFGVNFWIRREVLNGGRLCDESIGPRPESNYLMGSEASLLTRLAADGYKIMYSPDAVVGHRVKQEMLTERYVKDRAYRLGMGRPHWKGFEPRDLFDKHPVIWRLAKAGGLLRGIAEYARAEFSLSRDRRVLRKFWAVRKMAFNIESLKLSLRKKKPNSSGTSMMRKYVPEKVKQPYRWLRAGILSMNLRGNGDYTLPEEELLASKDISLIIPVSDAPKVTSRCLGSVERYCGSAEVILVDDSSQLEETRNIIHSFQERNRWRLINHQRRLGHSRACNHGAEFATRKYLCFLNSDTVLTPWSWRAAKEAFESDVRIAVTGPSTSRASTRQQILRATYCRMYWSDRQIWAFARRYVSGQAVRSWVDLPYVGGFALFIRRRIWNQFRGFDTKIPDYGNELELCKRLTDEGYRVVWTANSYIHHFGESSYDNLDASIRP